MNRICFFSTYFESAEIPYYHRYYLTELSRHCKKVVFISHHQKVSEDSARFLSSLHIDFLNVSNEGFDFGMYFKALSKYKIEEYEMLLLVNDSCVLFKPLDKVLNSIDANPWEYAGILDTRQVAYHVQSYFIAIKSSAFPILKNYFEKHGVLKNIQEVIATYEIGLSELMIQSKMKVGAVFSNEVCHPDLNPSYSGIEKLLSQGFPMIKRKILFNSYRKKERVDLLRLGFNIHPMHYFKILKEAIGKESACIDLQMLRRDYPQKISWWRNAWFSTYAFLFNTLRRIPFLKRIVKFFVAD